MKAIVQHRYGSAEVLVLTDVDTPVIDDDSLLVRVHAASVNPVDWHMMTGRPYVLRLQGGLRRPKAAVRGHDVSGVVESVGRNVRGFRPGDEVFGVGAGSFAEHVGVKAAAVARKPAALTHVQAACAPIAGITALQALRDKGRLRPGQSVLVIGASGGVGTFAVQIAKVMGAEVTGVCSTANIELVRALGAGHVIDYVRDDFFDGTRKYDLIIDNAGHSTVKERRRAMAPSGRCVIVGAPKDGRLLGPLLPMVRAVAVSRFTRQRFVPFLAKIGHDDLVALATLMEQGEVTPVVGATFALAEAPAAMRQIESGHTRGKLAIIVDDQP